MSLEYVWRNQKGEELDVEVCVKKMKMNVGKEVSSFESESRQLFGSENYNGVGLAEGLRIENKLTCHATSKEISRAKRDSFISFWWSHASYFYFVYLV